MQDLTEPKTQRSINNRRLLRPLLMLIGVGAVLFYIFFLRGSTRP